MGELDECGVCNGPGPTEVLIEDIVLTYDSVFLPLENDWYVFAVSADTTFGYTCAPFFGECGDPVSYQGYDYATVLIGEQCWFAENLRNENYGNGDAIPTGLSDTDWENTSSGAVAVYGEGNSDCFEDSPDGDACDEAWSLNEYGRLYNWYAVDDPRGLCPSGWHTPSDGEWDALTDFLDCEYECGWLMKSTSGWWDNSHGTNSSGFTALPSGLRRVYGPSPPNYSPFIGAGSSSYWWSSTSTGSLAWNRWLGMADNSLMRDPENPSQGYSVRCLRDSE